MANLYQQYLASGFSGKYGDWLRANRLGVFRPKTTSRTTSSRTTSSTSSPEPVKSASRPTSSSTSIQNYQRTDQQAATSTSAAKKRIIAIYKSKGLEPPSNLDVLARNAVNQGYRYFDTVRVHADNAAQSTSSTGGSSGGSSGGSTGGSTGGSSGGLSGAQRTDQHHAQNVILARQRIIDIYENKGLEPPDNLDAMAERAVELGYEYFDTVRKHAERAGGSGGGRPEQGGSDAAEEGLTAEEIAQNIADQQAQAAEEAREQRRQERMKDAHAIIRTTLEDYGLPESLADWAWTRLQAGDPASKIMLDLRERKEFKDRFPGIELRRQNGLPPIKPGEYIEYEERAMALMRESNLPEGFYDDRMDLGKLIGGNVTLDQLAKRIQQGYLAVSKSPREVREVFQQYYGVNGDSALAAFFLDPDTAETLLSDAVDRAEVGGAGLRFGLDIAKDRAGRIAKVSGKANLEQRFQSINRMSALFRETASEQDDFTAEGIGVNAVFGIDDPGSERTLRRRLERRSAAFAGRTGAATGQEGFFGLGSTRRS